MTDETEVKGSRREQSLPLSAKKSIVEMDGTY